MPGALQPPAARAGVAFELERADVEAGRLVLSGRWSGVRGMRFVRPALVVRGRQVLATLEHKPWAPGEEPWIAAFPWDGDAVDLAGVALAVAPSVTVALGPAVEDDAEGRAPQVVAPAVAVDLDHLEPDPDALRLRRFEAEVRFVRDELHTVERERDELRDQLDRAREAGAERDELRRAVAAAERDRDRAREQLEEAVHDREAAVRTWHRMEAQHEAAMRACTAAVQQRDRAVAQRDEVLLAHRALQRSVDRDRAHAGRERPVPAPESAGSADRAGDEPIGVRAIPAARAVAADLHRGTAQARAGDVSKFDLWAIRFFGSIAAVSFTLLLVMLLRLFI